MRSGLADVFYFMYNRIAPSYSSKLPVGFRYLSIWESLHLHVIVGKVNGYSMRMAVLRLQSSRGHFGFDDAHKLVFKNQFVRIRSHLDGIQVLLRRTPDGRDPADQNDAQTQRKK